MEHIGAYGARIWPAQIVFSIAALLLIGWLFLKPGHIQDLLIKPYLSVAFAWNGIVFFLTLAKGITGGYLPLAATLTTREIFDAFLGPVREHRTFYHGHTYTGNALGCAAALASIELFEKNRVLESLPAKIELLDDYFRKFAGLPYVGDARHCGLMSAIEIVRDKPAKESFPYELTIGARLCASMRPDGVMLRPLGDCIVVMPPVAIDLDLLRELLEVVGNALERKLPRIIEEVYAA